MDVADVSVVCVVVAWDDGGCDGVGVIGVEEVAIVGDVAVVAEILVNILELVTKARTLFFTNI